MGSFSIFQSENNPHKVPWLKYIEQGKKSLKKENNQDFSRPSTHSDKLYMCIGEKAIIEVAHPMPSDGDNKFEFSFRSSNYYHEYEIFMTFVSSQIRRHSSDSHRTYSGWACGC